MEKDNTGKESSFKKDLEYNAIKGMGIGSSLVEKWAEKLKIKLIVRIIAFGFVGYIGIKLVIHLINSLK